MLNFLRNNEDRFVAYALPVTAALIICRAFPVLSFFYFGVPLILFSTLVFYLTPARLADNRLRVLLILIGAFGGWAALTSIWSPFPFVSLARTAYFFLISISSILLGYLWCKNKGNDLFGYLLPANIIVVVVSLYSLLTSAPANAWTGGHGLGFMGYAGHQNTLASAIVFTIPSVLLPLLKEIKERILYKSQIKSDPGYLAFSTILILSIIFILNLYLLIISVSRGGLMTLIIMLLIFFVLSFNTKAAMLLLFFTVTASAVSFYSSEAVREFTFKTEQNVGDRRIVNIKETIDAAKNGGLFGIGYGVSQPPSSKKIIGHFESNGQLFVREKMIGALALIEEVGLIGLGLFLAIIGFVFWHLLTSFKIKNSRLKNLNSECEAAFLFAVLIGFCFHAQVEAWWVGVGSFGLPLFFMILGQGVKKD